MMHDAVLPRVGRATHPAETALALCWGLSARAAQRSKMDAAILCWRRRATHQAETALAFSWGLSAREAQRSKMDAAILCWTRRATHQAETALAFSWGLPARAAQRSKMDAAILCWTRRATHQAETALAFSWGLSARAAQRSKMDAAILCWTRRATHQAETALAFSWGLPARAAQRSKMDAAILCWIRRATSKTKAMVAFCWGLSALAASSWSCSLSANIANSHWIPDIACSEAFCRDALTSDCTANKATKANFFQLAIDISSAITSGCPIQIKLITAFSPILVSSCICLFHRNQWQILYREVSSLNFMIGIIHISPTWKDLRNGIMSVKDLWRSQVNICSHPDRKLKKSFRLWAFCSCWLRAKTVSPIDRVFRPISTRKTEDLPFWSMSMSWFKTNKSNPWIHESRNHHSNAPPRNLLLYASLCHGGHHRMIGIQKMR